MFSVRCLSNTVNVITQRSFSSGLSTQSLISPNVLPNSIANNENITHRIISGQHTHELKNNIILSQRPDHGWSHLELTKDHIRIEYNGITKDYQDSASLYFENDEDIIAKGIPLCFKPTKIENKVCVGAGATIYLDRSEVADFLRDRPQQQQQLSQISA